MKRRRGEGQEGRNKIHRSGRLATGPSPLTQTERGAPCVTVLPHRAENACQARGKETRRGDWDHNSEVKEGETAGKGLPPTLSHAML